jgi:HEAT repeat protein
MMLAAVGLALMLGVGVATPAAQSSSGPTTQATDITAAIDQLGAYDFLTRTEAAKRIRRAQADTATRALERAVTSHQDSYVRFRALVLLTGFWDSAAQRVMTAVLLDQNDRLRTAAYQWFERHPDSAVVPTLVGALQRETSEFVRPALTRALAAHGDDARVRAALVPLVTRGDDMFRGAVIEALGDYRGAFALAALTGVARVDGPLQDDAITALGKIGDPAAVSTLAALQKDAGSTVQPTIAASLCLLDVQCDAQFAYVQKTFAYAVARDDQSSLRGAVHALSMLATAGKQDALVHLLDGGAVDTERVRAPVALGIGSIALRRPGLVIDALEQRGLRTADLELLRDAFDMLSEEFEEERFYAELRRQFWAAPDGSPRRRTAERLMAILEF